MLKMYLNNHIFHFYCFNKGFQTKIYAYMLIRKLLLIRKYECSIQFSNFFLYSVYRLLLLLERYLCPEFVLNVISLKNRKNLMAVFVILCC